MEAQDVQAQPTGMIKEVEWNAQDTNFVAMIGHLGSDPELRQFPSGACKASLNLAVNRKVKDKEKETYWCAPLATCCVLRLRRYREQSTGAASAAISTCSSECPMPPQDMGAGR